MSTQELVTSIIAEQDDGADQFLDIISQKIDDAIEVKRIELASQMFEASKKCPECGKADCECDDEEEDDMEEMDEEVEQMEEGLFDGVAGAFRDAGAKKFKKLLDGGTPASQIATHISTMPAKKRQDIKSAISHHLKSNDHAGLKKLHDMIGEEFEQIDEKVMVGDKVKIHYKGSQAHGMVGRVEDIYPDEGGTHAKVRISKGTSTSVPIGSLKRHKKVSEEVEQIDEGGNYGTKYDPVKHIASMTNKEIEKRISDWEEFKQKNPNMPHRVTHDQLAMLRAERASRIGKKKTNEEAEQIDEISKGAAIRAAGVAGSNDDRRTTSIINRIHKKFGSKAADDAEAHAHAQYYGRDGKSRGTDPLNSVLDRPSFRRITKKGKLHPQDQKALASAIKGRMKMHAGKYQRKKPIPEEFEHMDEQFTLHAVHDEMGTKKKLGSFASKGEAAAHLNKLEKAGKFPEGHEAVLTDKNGQKHMYTDKWEQMDEMAPPGEKYERMVKHIKKAYSKGRLTKNEKSIAYATAWKAKNREMSEAAMTDAQQMAALGLKGAERAKMMMAVSAYRKHGDINKLSASHRSLVSGYMEKTGGLSVVNRNTALQALKKERMQEE